MICNQFLCNNSWKKQLFISQKGKLNMIYKYIKIAETVIKFLVWVIVDDIYSYLWETISTKKPISINKEKVTENDLKKYDSVRNVCYFLKRV